MAKFNGKIHAEFTPPKTWILEETLSLQLDELSLVEIETLSKIGANISSAGRITCKTGMKTDLASTPRILWNIIAPWDVARAAVIHDHLYSTLRNYYHESVIGIPIDLENKKIWKKARKIADKVFLLGMQAAQPAISKFKMHSSYNAVRIFGRWPASAKPK